jgi:hypothetical protein
MRSCEGFWRGEFRFVGLAPGAGWGRWKLAPGAGRGRLELAPGERDAAVSARPWQAVAVAETAGGAGRGAGDAGEACGRRRRDGASVTKTGRIVTDPQDLKTPCMNSPHQGVVNSLSVDRPCHSKVNPRSPTFGASMGTKTLATSL